MASWQPGKATLQRLGRLESQWCAAQVEIATRREGGDLAIGDGASEHPEAAIGMDPTDASGAEDTFGALDGPRDLLGRFDVIDLHIETPEEIARAIERAE